MRTYESRDRVILERISNGTLSASKAGEVFTFTNGRWVERPGLVEAGGYLTINLGDPISKKAMKVKKHRVVYLFFHGPIDSGMQIDHINRSKTCNNIENLRAVTAKQNAVNYVHLSAESAPSARFDWEDVKNIRARFCAGTSSTDLACEYGTSDTHILNIVHGRVWVDPGYTPPAHRFTNFANRALSPDDVRDILSNWAANPYRGFIKRTAEKYSVHPMTISQLVHGKRTDKFLGGVL